MPVDGDDDARVNEDDDAYADSRREDTSANASASAASKGNKGDCVDAAIRVITSHPAPLVIYVFTEREGVKDRCEWPSLSFLALHGCLVHLYTAVAFISTRPSHSSLHGYRVPCPLRTEMSAKAC